MNIEIVKNGAQLQPAAAMVTTSWVRDDYSNGRKRIKLYALHVPVMQAIAGGGQAGRPAPLSVSYPQMAGAPTVIGEATLEVPNFEVAKMLHAALGEMLAKQPPEIVTVQSK